MMRIVLHTSTPRHSCVGVVGKDCNDGGHRHFQVDCTPDCMHSDARTLGEARTSLAEARRRYRVTGLARCERGGARGGS